ncbi:Asp-tRNA(Asn)/Glu-tRNA(Gln) amidotransferase subunit GatC [Tanticharoenia sakaeratensis]|jgi:aspartyl-tRNA(Asn)/glutamyl-tRNA(Gln) amidotransferase subunit C|uniref:Aspartyl/glutamyl-tRNA(Asn/Gln) amidotransferase subunit C n=1 Tax=Tanticharoenia sakaeratensis NBRC 103193 TaxID=1231623 RepID=A0A0D6MJD7_9PROT|nr:Asp-tRNA(Asn)/Glu-tRNA(Gln) amidotransferase subunit GatC [Tanticharoenia sakaeratensis]GAN53388.1 glutamyl-tRNA(Gln) amidotransferase subunit C [Tanticharoenia sakaeratensis NBRC 103193]GBQ20788.1 glutamyl-tRNA amidotransferase subunit C [Tanticharoenia sakaeratensis NBRC 103193]
MPLDAQTVRRIARLARIGVADDELVPLGHELDGIIGWVEQLGEVDVDGVPPMIGTGLAMPRLREDAVTDGNRREDVLSNAPDRVDAYFTVPKVVE